MDDAKNEQRPRASLRGKGREILLGQHADADPLQEIEAVEKPAMPSEKSETIDAASLTLTAEERAALLNFSPRSPAYDTEMPLPVVEKSTPHAPDDSTKELTEQATDQTNDISAIIAEENFDAVPILPATSTDEMVLEDWDPFEINNFWETNAEANIDSTDIDDVGADQPEENEISIASPVILSEMPPVETESQVQEALPLAERTPDLAATEPILYHTDRDIDGLTPQEPEQWLDVIENAQMNVSTETDFDDELTVLDEEHEGGPVIPEGATLEKPATSGLPDPFDPALQRQTSQVLFEQTAGLEPGLLALLVSDERIQKLARQIDELQDRVTQDVRSDRDATDVYQKELLQASGLLMTSRENYDDARAIVYRVHADLNRQRKVEADIMRFRPRLLNYYLGWGIALAVLYLLKNLLVDMAETVEAGILSALYVPILLGIAGALISGYFTLERHTTKLRDFDPMHISWYLFNPLLGGVMGLLMFLIASIANEDLLQAAASTPEVAIAYLLCVVAGMNQNHILRQLDNLLKQFGSNGG